MPWEPIKNPDSETRQALEREFGGKVRILVDESLDPDLTLALGELGWKAQSVSDAGLSGRSDEDVLAHAWRTNQFLLTSDHDFLDDRRFPPHRNPGIIILPNAAIDSDSFANALQQALYTIAPLGKTYRGSKIVITSDGVITITSRDIRTCTLDRDRFLLHSKGTTYTCKAD